MQIIACVGQLYDDFCGFMEKENRITEFGLYGLSSAGLLYAYVRKRPFLKFTKASDIPNHFLKEKVLQNGIVRKIEPSEEGPVILVNHKPPFLMSFSQRALPIKVAAVQIDGNGYSWLQILTTGKKIKFLPLTNNGNECTAKVFLIQESKKDLDIGRALVGLGFAKTGAIRGDIDSKGFAKYHMQLKISETKAKSLRKGQWHALPESFLRWFLRTQLEKFLYNLKPRQSRLPPLVR